MASTHSRRAFCLLAGFVASAVAAAAVDSRVFNTAAPQTLDVAVAADGSYTVLVDGAAWFTSGDTSVTLGGRLYSAHAGTLALSGPPATGAGKDALGAFSTTALVWLASDAARTPFYAEVRVYAARPAVRFLASFPAGDKHVPPARAGGTSATFPSLVLAPGAPSALGSVWQPPGSGNCGWTVAGAPNVTASGALLILAPPLPADGAAPPAPRAALGFAAATNIATVRQALAPAFPGGPLALSAGPADELALPANYAYSTLLVASSSAGGDSRAAGAAAAGMPPGGVNAAMLALGDGLMAVTGKARPTHATAGPIYTHLGYSTTAFYFYNPCDGGRWPNGTSPPGRSHLPGPTGAACATYADTMAAVRDGWSGLPPVRHVLLDSFWYGEGIFNGVSQWTDSPSLMAQVDSFPAGLAAWAATLDPGVVLWAHNGKFIDASPYVSDARYSFLRPGDIPQGPALWDDVFTANAAGWRLAQIKQDHVGDYLRAAGTITNASVMDAWMGGMAAAALRHSVTIQYCCSPPAVLHAGVAYGAAIGARASPDYVANAPGGVRPLFQWAVGTETLAHYYGLGLWPDKDTVVTNSSSTQHGGDGVPSANAPSFYGFTEKNALKHILAAALSGGPTSFSDAAGEANATLIAAVTRADGLVLRTSRPQTALDAEFNGMLFGAWRGAGHAPAARNAADATAAAASARAPSVGKPDSSLPNGALGEVYSSVTVVGNLTWHVLYAAQLGAPLTVYPADVALDGAGAAAYVASAWDTAAFAPAASPPPGPFPPSVTLRNVGDDGSYAAPPTLVVLAPRVPAGGGAEWVLLGEVGKAVPVSPQRVQSVAGTAGGGLRVGLLGAAGGESVTLAACRVAEPFACAPARGTCAAPGAMTFAADGSVSCGGARESEE